jgi:hypothetical protein
MHARRHQRIEIAGLWSVIERNVRDVSSEEGKEKNLTYAVLLYDAREVIRFASRSAKLSLFLDSELCSG